MTIKSLSVVLIVSLGAAVGYLAGSLRPNQVVYDWGYAVANNCYTIWTDGSHYFARNGWTGLLDYSDRNFTHLFEKALDAMPYEGGTIHLKPGTYEGWTVIDRDGVILEGEGAFAASPSGLPDDPPTHLTGTVLKVATASKNAIHIQGQRNGIT